jgi:hypothetical protein
MTETLDYGDHDEDDTTRKSSRSRQRRVASRVCTRSRSVGSLRTLSPRRPPLLSPAPTRRTPLSQASG